MYDLIIALCAFGAIIISLLGIKGIHRRDETITTLRNDLAKEKEKLRLLNKLNPKPKDEDGFEFVYTEKFNRLMRINFDTGLEYTICRLEPETDTFYGYRIAKLLNDGYVVGNPIGRNLEVKSKIERINDMANTNIPLEDENAIRKAEIEETKKRVFDQQHDQIMERFAPPKPTKETK